MQKQSIKFSENYFLARVSKDTSSLTKDKISLWGILIGFLSLIVSYGYVLFHLDVIPPQLPLFYTRLWGQKQLGTPLQLHLLLWGSVGILLLNIFLASRIHAKETFLSRSLIWGGALVALLTAITSYKIVALIV